MISEKNIKTLRLQLVRSNKCNLNCFYCCKEGCDTSFSVLNDENVINIIKTAKEMLDVKRVKYTGGEPLLYGQSIINIIDKIDKEYRDNNYILQSIVTNGTFTDTIKSLIDKKYNLDWTISLPTLNPETFKKITGHDSQKLRNILNSIDYICKNDVPLKINCVLIKGINTLDGEINRIIDEFKNKSNVKLRFLNLIDNRVTQLEQKYLLQDSDFNILMNNLGFTKDIEKESRSTSIYKKNETTIKLIKFFCNNSCNECPEDKTSLWVTSEGEMKKCSFDNMVSHRISNWTYKGLCDELKDFYL
ncbi:MAG: radical SAM protein [Clostridium beijerinckii]|nr:radical SAM protein [Clostridium beijerinckii]